MSDEVIEVPELEYACLMEFIDEKRDKELHHLFLQFFGRRLSQILSGHLNQKRYIEIWLEEKPPSKRRAKND